MNIKELENKVISANTAYFIDNNPIMEDSEYDKLVEELKQVEPNSPVLDIIGDRAGNCVHPYPMLSLDKAYDHKTICKWLDTVSRSQDEQILVQPKYDGCTCRITDSQMFTRGNGICGENITQVKPITKYHLIDKEDVDEIPNDDLGEILISNKDFKEYILTGQYTRLDGTKFSNSRNATSGILGRKIVELCSYKILTFVSYNSLSYPITSSELKNIDCFNKLITLVVESCEYPMDGVVFKLLDKEYSDSLGNTVHHPRGAIAYKFSNVQKATTIRNIIWSMGKEVYTPVAIVDTVNINGSNISQVTLHNRKCVHQHNLSIGDVIIIERAGDVIPKFVKVINHDRINASNEPKYCYYCGSELKYGDVELYCDNHECKGKLLYKLMYACKLLKLDGWGEQTLKQLMDNKIVNNLLDIFNISLKSLKTIFQDKTANNLYNQVKSLLNKGIDDYKLLAALCIRDIGPNISKEVLSEFNIFELYKHYNELNKDYVRSKYIKEWMDNNKEYYAQLLQLPIVMYTNMSKPKICFTGTMSKPRSELFEIAKSKGYEPVNTVSKDLKILVVPNIEHNSTKVKYAKDNNIKIITEQEF